MSASSRRAPRFRERRARGIRRAAGALGAQPIQLPPLHERPEDLGRGVTSWARRGGPPFDSEAFQALFLYGWPHNIGIAKGDPEAELLSATASPSAHICPRHRRSARPPGPRSTAGYGRLQWQHHPHPFRSASPTPRRARAQCSRSAATWRTCRPLGRQGCHFPHLAPLGSIPRSSAGRRGGRGAFPTAPADRGGALLDDGRMSRPQAGAIAGRRRDGASRTKPIRRWSPAAP